MAKLYPDDDQVLLSKLQQSCEKAFSQIYDKYWELVYTDAFRRLKDRAQAKDITQEIFLKLWVRRESLQIENLRGYLRVSARNRVLNLFEKENRYVPFEQLLLKVKEKEGADFLAVKNEFLEAYKALVKALPTKRQKIFRYHFEEGLSTDEIAKKLELSRKTVQNQLGRAVYSLKTVLTHFFVIVVIFFL